MPSFVKAIFGAGRGGPETRLQHKMLGLAIPSPCTGYPQVLRHYCYPARNGETRYYSASPHHSPEGFCA